MPQETVDSLVEALRGRPILRPEQFSELLRDHLPSHEDSQELARTLIRLRWLTVYQAKKLLAGKGDELVIGPYVVLDKLGEGGMGKVYQATQLSLGRVVALKVVRASLLKNETALKRFRREVKAAADLNHPNIVRVFDADQVGDRHFLAMEYIPGIDLARMVKDRGPVPVPMACSFVRQAALGLQHAHQRKMVHRDIKPSNLLASSSDRKQYTPRSTLKILDMGLARIQNDGDPDNLSTELTRTGTVIGTPDFMSPEQAKNSSAVDHRSDLYSLGCTFYFLLSGEVPFPIGTPLEKLLQHQMDTPRPIQMLRMEVPPEVATIVHCLLAKRPDERFQSAAALAHALEPWSGLNLGTGQHPATVLAAEAVEPGTVPLEHTSDPFDFGAPEPIPDVPIKLPPPLPRIERPRPIPWLFIGVAIALAVLLVMLAALGIFLATRKRGEDPPTATEPNRTANTQPSPGRTTRPETIGLARELESAEKYLPTDSTMVAIFDAKSWQNSSAGKRYVLNPLAARLAEVSRDIQADLFENVERVVLATVPEDRPGDLLILQGRGLITQRLLENTRKLPNVSSEPIGESGAELFRLGEEEAVHFVAVETSIILSRSRDRVLAALERRDGSAKPKLADATLERGLEAAASRPYAVFATLGLKSGWARDLPAAEKIQYLALGAILDDRGMLFQTIGEETEPGSILEVQRTLGKILEERANDSSSPQGALRQLARVLQDAEPTKGALLGKNRRAISHYLVPARRLEEFFAPFLGRTEDED